MSNECHSCRKRKRPDGDPRGQVERDHWHHLNCIEGHGGAEISLRHHMIVNAIARYSRLAGAVVYVEPQHLFDSSYRRPDLQINLNHITFLLDVAVTNPTAPSIMRRVNRPLMAAKEKERSKENSYRELMENYNSASGDQCGLARHPATRFVPFVVEAFGGMGSQAEAFLRTLSVFARDNLSAWSHYDVVEGLKQAVAIAIQRGNSYVVLAGYQNSSEAFNRS
jgi:hypothetical protein